MRTNIYSPGRLASLLLAIALLLALTSGCVTAVIRTPKKDFTGYAATPKVGLKVRLEITDDLRKPEWKRHHQAIRLGDYLARNVELLARHVFREVVLSTDSASPATVNAVLTPKTTYINRTQGATSFGESITTVKIEWNLADTTGKPVWLETITGEARGSTGWTAPDKLLRKALEDLLLKSQQAMTSAETIRAFTARCEASAKGR